VNITRSSEAMLLDTYYRRSLMHLCFVSASSEWQSSQQQSAMETEEHRMRSNCFLVEI